MRRLAVGSAVAFIGGLLTYEAVALAASLLALAIACLALYRVNQADKRLRKREVLLETRSTALGEALSDDLGGD